jgi:hypothetical protein
MDSLAWIKLIRASCVTQGKMIGNRRYEMKKYVIPYRALPAKLPIYQTLTIYMMFDLYVPRGRRLRPVHHPRPEDPGGVAHYTAAVMQRKLVKARSQFASAHRFYDRSETTRQAGSFYHGWVEAVGKTVHDFAMADDLRKELDEEYDNRCKGKPAKTRKTQLGSGYHAGVVAGKGESIHRPLNERSPVLQIGG